MEIKLKQADIEAAIKAHLVRMGFDRPVTEMAFTAGRKNTGITVDIEVSDPFTEAAPERVETPDEKPKARNKPKAVEKEEVATPAKEEEKEEPPFKPDTDAEATNEDDAAPAGKSLFG